MQDVDNTNAADYSPSDPLQQTALLTQIADQKQTQRLMSRQERMLTAICEQAKVGGWEVDVATGELVWSDITREIHEVPEGFMPDLEVGIEFYKAGQHRDRIRSVLEKAMTEGGGWNEELLLVTYTGHDKWVRAIGMVEFENGQPVKLFGTFQDIDKQKRIEQDLEAARDAAETATKAKSDFLATMSHEIRTPMNGVVGMLELLTRTELSDEQSRLVSVSQSSAETLLTIINDILNFSRVDSGMLAIETIEFDLIKTFSTFAESAAISAEKSGLDLILDMHQIDSSRQYRGDPHRIRQILENLVSNAIKFTERGEILIRAEVNSPHAGSSVLNCSISDTGIGIPADKQPYLFEAFTQVDASTSRKYGGTGLGLAIISKLCQLMGGDISLAESTAKGSTFTFSIELETIDQNARIQMADPNASVLIIAPMNTARQATENQLKAWGVSVETADSLIDALEYLDHRLTLEPLSSLHTSLVDVDLVRDTDETELKRLQQHPVFAASKKVLMTRSSNHNDSQQKFASSFDGYLSRPTTPISLGNLFLEKSEYETQHEDSVEISELSSQLAQKARILLVEDNEINQFLINELLTDLGLDCHIANDGIEALDCLKDDETPWDVIIMDCQMPRLDGYAASKQIRAGAAGHRHVTVPIVALTAHAMQGDREKCIAAGMDEYLTKPIDPDALEDVLGRILSHTDQNAN